MQIHSSSGSSGSGTSAFCMVWLHLNIAVILAPALAGVFFHLRPEAAIQALERERDQPLSSSWSLCYLVQGCSAGRAFSSPGDVGLLAIHKEAHHGRIKNRCDSTRCTLPDTALLRGGYSNLRGTHPRYMHLVQYVSSLDEVAAFCLLEGGRGFESAVQADYNGTTVDLAIALPMCDGGVLALAATKASVDGGLAQEFLRVAEIDQHEYHACSNI